MKKIISETPYKWVIDKTVVSKHIRESVEHYIKHVYNLERLILARNHVSEYSFLKLMRLFATSLGRGLIIAFMKHEPSLFWVYPRIRWVILKAYLEGGVSK
jgi:hypothetical protein